MVYILYFLILPLLIQGQISFWDKHYITYSVENDFHRVETIRNSIKEMEINTLEIEHVRPGKGDIKIYFKNYIPGNVLGIAEPPDSGIIKICLYEVKRTHANMSRVIQHEFAHALGLDHSKDNKSIMFPRYVYGSSFLKADKDNLNELYKCRYDSVILLNDRTYIKFKGRNYERMDLNVESVVSKNKIWHPSIFKVNAMYKNNTYFLISNDVKYFEFNHTLQFIKEGKIRDIFPNIDSVISAVLTLRNGSIICFFENREIWYDGIKSNVQGDYKETLPTSALLAPVLFNQSR